MHQIEIELDVTAEMRDGTVLRADVYRPVGLGPWPVLLQRTPYSKRGVGNYGLVEPIAAAQRGYIVVHQDTRGSAASDGEWLPFVFEREDGYDSVEWAARLPGSNGRVGMLGASYTGSTQWSAAMMQPPSLAAIAPMVTWSDPDDGFLFRGGATELGLNTSWGIIQSFGQLHKNGLSESDYKQLLARTMRSFDELATRGYWELPSGAQPSMLNTGQPDIGVARALRDPATRQDTRVSDRYGDVTVPTLHLAGWYDIFQSGPIDGYLAMQALGRPAHLIIGPWHHYSMFGTGGGQTGDVNFGLHSVAPPGFASISDIQLAWNDHWLKGLEPNGLHRPGVDVFVMGINEWRFEEVWPPARAVDTALFLQPDGGAGAVAPEAEDRSSDYVYDPSDPVMTRGGSMLMVNEFPPGPTDQRTIEDRDDVLVFTTDTLDEDVEVTGRLRARLFVETDAPTTDWVVRLCDVDENGLSLNIADGIVRLESEPGAITEVEVDLWSTSIVFRAGHRMRVHVTSSSFPRWDRNLNTTVPVAAATESRIAHQRVHHDRKHPSAVILPVIPSAGG